jgi:hypothetical protein
MCFLMARRIRPGSGIVSIRQRWDLKKRSKNHELRIKNILLTPDIVIMKQGRILFLVLVVGIMVGCTPRGANESPGFSEATSSSQTATTMAKVRVEAMRELDYSHVAELTGEDEAWGMARVGVVDGEYQLLATFEHLSEIDEQQFFYEGWVVRSQPGSVVSTGPLEIVDDEWVNTFVSGENLLDYESYVLTLEPTDDGPSGQPDPAPAEHVLEGRFVVR